MHPDDGRVVSNFIMQALRGDDITIYGNGHQTRAFFRLKAYKHLPALRAALAKQGQQPPSDEALVQIPEAA